MRPWIEKIVLKKEFNESKSGWNIYRQIDVSFFPGQQSSHSVGFRLHIGRLETETGGPPGSLAVKFQDALIRLKRRFHCGSVLEDGPFPQDGLAGRLLIIETRMLRLDGRKAQFYGVLKEPAENGELIRQPGVVLETAQRMTDAEPEEINVTPEMSDGLPRLVQKKRQAPHFVANV